MKKSAIRRILGSVAVAGSMLSLSQHVEAASLYLQAGAGMPFLGTGWHEWDNIQNSSKFELQDGRLVNLKANQTGTWIIPIPLPGTNKTWYLRHAAIEFDGGSVESRICSFSSLGIFTSCSARIDESANLSTSDTTSVFVPQDGTAFTQHFMVANSEPVVLSQVRVFD